MGRFGFYSLVLFFNLNAYAQGAASWTSKINVNGDLRYRHEYTSKLRQNATSESHRERLRMRLGLQGEVNESMKLKFRLATSEGGNPISNNQTMTNNADKKSVLLDLAYLDWNLADGANLALGKQENPLRLLPQSQLIYDVDYTPEGISLSTQGSLFANVAAYSLLERGPNATDGTSEPDSWLLAGVMGFRADLSDSSGFMLAIGYHHFTALKDNAALAPGATNNDFFGNSSAANRYSNNYQVAEGLAEWHLKSRDFNLSIYADYIQNTLLTEHNHGLVAGTVVSTLNDAGKANWTLGYSYTSLDRDATVSALNHSDVGNGMDGLIAHSILVGKALAANTTMQLNWAHASIDNSGNAFESDKGMFDLVFVF